MIFIPILYIVLFLFSAISKALSSLWEVVIFHKGWIIWFQMCSVCDENGRRKKLLCERRQAFVDLLPVALFQLPDVLSKFHSFCFYNALGIYPSRRWSCGVLSPLPWIRPRVPAAALWYERSYLYISSCCGGVVRNDRRNCHLRCNHFRIGHICLQICLRLALAPDLSLPSKQTLLNEFHCFTRN